MIRNYGELIEAFTARRKELGLSQADVDARAGFADGYCAKVEAWRGKSGRGLGLITLPLLLETLGVTLEVVPSEQPKPGRHRPLTAEEHRLRVRRGVRQRDRRFSAAKGRKSS